MDLTARVRHRAHRSAIAVGLTAAALATSLTAPAAADAPRRFHDEWSDVSTDYTWPCDVPYTRTIDVRLDVAVHEQRDARGFLSAHWHVHKTITNPENGRSVRFRSAGQDRMSAPAEDGSHTLVMSGTSQSASVPGAGRSFSGSGRAEYRYTPIAYDEDGWPTEYAEELIREVGTWIDDPTELCAYLAGGSA